MLRPSSVRDASTCLRCSLRLVLRQIQPRRYQSSDESPQTSQEFPASPSTPSSDQQQNLQAPRFRIVRHHVNHGKIRGKKGSQRRVESAEALSIASLGQDSEVIVLRDLHEPRVQTKKPDPPTMDDDFDDAEDSPLPPPTASDIENMSAGRRAIRPQDQEVFASIDGLRLKSKSQSEELVIKEKDFRAKFTALAKGYTIGQLKRYLLQETAITRMASSKARSSRRTFATEITSSSGELQDLKRTAWHAGTTPITRRLPIVAFSAREGFKMNNKEDVIESILRHAWKLRTEEEKAALGEIEFLLSPMQFGLLLTKNSATLQPLLESNKKFYRNSRFQLHQADHVVRIVGPRSEAEQIALVLTQAYAPAKSADIHLDHFDLALSADRSGYTLQDMLSPAQLTRIMQLTRTYIHYDITAKRLRVASFADVAINDAHRLLVALLDARRRTKVASIYDPHNAEDCRLEPITPNKDLPSFARYLQPGRWVTPSSKSMQSSVDQTPLDTEESHSITKHDNKMRPGDAGVAHSPLNVRGPIMKRAFAIMKTRLDSSEHALDTNVSIWPERPIYDFWRAHVGLSLHNHEAKATYPGAQGLSVNEEKYARDHRNIFTSKVPGLVGLLASIPPNDPKKEARVRRTRLLAHLIPSPFEQASTWASTAFPKIQLRFYIEGSSEVRLSEKDVFADLPSGKRIVFQDMRAIIRTEIVQLNLPSHPADIQFKREQRLVSRRVSDDAGIRSFIDAIFESMKNDAVLRAPPALEIPVPQRIVTPMPERYLPQMRGAVRGLKAQVLSKEATKGGVVPVKYLFAGFEYQEARDFDLGTLAPYHRADVRSHEAGVTGGRHLDLSLISYAKPTQTVEDSKSVERLVDASARVINALAESQVGQLRSRTYWDHGTRSRKTSKTAVEPGDHYKETEQRRLDQKMASRAEEISNSGSTELTKAPEQESALELGSDQEHSERETLIEANPQEAITVDKPEGQTRVFDESAEQEQTEQMSSTEASSSASDASASTSSTNDNDMTEQTPAQTSPEPETQEVKAEEAKAPGEEPLSVRLQRMMGGGR